MRLQQLYASFADAHMVPLWTEIGDLMPAEPRAKAAPWLWRWSDLYPLARSAGELVAVGRGGERRAIALARLPLQIPLVQMSWAIARGDG